ncbi:hypothetical protein [Xinzhou nematode virus 1]|uniref:hypothetical protein n=1 Tax=Xinzhou nematode virus 1 TaxID=1923769 RepID=UPI00090BA26E|nr:hypothetical protein [Xinzhou nematode virus 1]APG77856.1 hypothetical protein [Xinzhou nematode virus 1]
MSTQQLLVPSEDNRPPKFYNLNTGIQSIRGGQQVGDGFFASAANSFYNIIYHAWALLFAILALLILLSEYGTSAGPLEILFKALMKFKEDPFAPVILKSIASGILYILGYMITYKMAVGYALLLLVPVMVKPSARNFVFAAVIILLAFMHYITIIQVLILAILFYLFVMLRTPAHKFFIVAMAVAVFGVGITTGPDSIRFNITSYNLETYTKPLSFKPNLELFKSLPTTPYSLTKDPQDRDIEDIHKDYYELRNNVFNLLDHIEQLGLDRRAAAASTTTAATTSTAHAPSVATSTTTKATEKPKQPVRTGPARGAQAENVKRWKEAGGDELFKP